MSPGCVSAKLWWFLLAGLLVALALTAVLLLLAGQSLQYMRDRSMTPVGNPHSATPSRAQDMSPGGLHREGEGQSGLGFTWDPLPSRPPRQSRRRHHHIVFLKTHKTGGSTVQNLLFRLAEKEGLTFAFPYFTYQFGYPQRFREEFVDELPPGASQFDILCSHMRLDLPQLRRMMPADSIYLTILRDPVSTFESVFSYYASMVPAFTLVQNRASDSPGGPDQRQLLAAFLASPESYYDPADPSNGLARNPMTFDLGLGPREWNASWAGELAKLAEAFHLVMIAKHFDESLVLLKELLQLDYQDLVYVELNARPGPDRAQPDEELRARVRSWNALDVLLYEHFSRLFWEKARRYGLRRLAEGVRELRALARRTRRRCLQREGVPPGELEDLLRPWQPNSATILGYDLRGNLSAQEQGSCLRLVLPELQYHSYLYFQQYGRDLRLVPAG